MKPQRNMEGPRYQQNDFLLKQLRKDSISFASENFNPNGFNKSIDSKETILSCNMIFSLPFSLSEYMKRISNQAVVFSKSKKYLLPQDSGHLIYWHNQLINSKLFSFILYFWSPKSQLLFSFFSISHMPTHQLLQQIQFFPDTKEMQVQYSDNSFLTH